MFYFDVNAFPYENNIRNISSIRTSKTSDFGIIY